MVRNKHHVIYSEDRLSRDLRGPWPFHRENADREPSPSGLKMYNSPYIIAQKNEVIKNTISRLPAPFLALWELLLILF